MFIGADDLRKMKSLSHRQTMTYLNSRTHTKDFACSYVHTDTARKCHYDIPFDSTFTANTS